MGIVIAPGREDNGHNARGKCRAWDTICTISISVSKIELNRAVLSDQSIWENAS